MQTLGCLPRKVHWTRSWLKGFMPTSEKDLIGADRAALVSLVRSTPSLPTVDQLRMLFRLGFQEATIALLLAEGRSNKDIAKHLGIRLSTVRTHVERIFRKMGVQSRKALGLLLLRSVAELSDCE